MANVTEISAGVQELIDKLKVQGVSAGQEQADQIIKDAQKQASDIIADARSKAEALYSQAHNKIQTEIESAHEAIKVAFRDSELTLRSKFKEAFSDYLSNLVSTELQDKDFIKQLVLVVSGLQTQEISKDQNIEVMIPKQLFESDEKEYKLNKEAKQSMRHLVLGISSQMLRQGVELKPSADFTGGIKVRLVGKDMEIDLTDQALSSLILKHLLPRYRQIVSGQE